MQEQDARPGPTDNSFSKAIIFLNGAYPVSDWEFYRIAARSGDAGTRIIAVDGALDFFAQAGLTPDVILGDFDSVSRAALEKFEGIKQIRFRSEKDATDGELAVRYALEAGCSVIEILGAVDTRFETDQMLANILLLKLIQSYAIEQGREIEARLTDHHQFIYFASDSTIKLHGHRRDLLSVVPFSDKCTISLTGTKWELSEQEIHLGSSLPLRNEFAEDHVSIAVAGHAIVIHRHAS